jgi:hypothetical protein
MNSDVHGGELSGELTARVGRGLSGSVAREGEEQGHPPVFIERERGEERAPGERKRSVLAPLMAITVEVSLMEKKRWGREKRGGGATVSGLGAS